MASKEVDKAAEVPVARPLNAAQLELQRNVLERVDQMGAWSDTSGLLEQILNAPNLDVARKVFETHDVKLYLGKRVTVVDVSFAQSAEQYAGSLGVFALIKLVDENTGEASTVTCGAESVVAWLLRARELDTFPAVVVFSPVQTAGGFTAYNVDLADF